MTSTVLGVPPYPEKLLARGHDETGSVADPEASPALFQEFNPQTMWSSSSDYARLLSFLVADVRATSGPLAEQSVIEMIRPNVRLNDAMPWSPGWPDNEGAEVPRVSWSLGWGIEHHKHGSYSICHWGATMGLRHLVVGSRRQRAGVVILTNGANGRETFRAVLDAATGRDHPFLDWLDRVD